MTVSRETGQDEPKSGEPGGSGRRWRRFAAGLLIAGGLAAPVVYYGGWEAGAIVFGGVITVAPKERGINSK